MWPKPRKSAKSAKFTEEILTQKLHFFGVEEKGDLKYLLGLEKT